MRVTLRFMAMGSANRVRAGQTHDVKRIEGVSVPLATKRSSVCSVPSLSIDAINLSTPAVSIPRSSHSHYKQPPGFELRFRVTHWLDREAQMWGDCPPPRPSVPPLSPARGRWALTWCLGTGKPPESLRRLSSAPGPAVQGVCHRVFVPLAAISFPSVDDISAPSLSCVTFWDSALCHQWCPRNLLFSWVLWPVLSWPALSWAHSALHLMVWTGVWLQNMNPSRPAQPTFHLCLPKDLAKEAILQDSVDSTLQALASISVCACVCVCLWGWSEAVSTGA